jgi:hypothetical protein
MRNRTLFWVFILAGVLAAASGCSKKHVSQPLGDQAPDTWFLSNIPRQSDTLADRTVLYWTGKDPDGQIVAYEYVVDNPSGQWTYLTADTSDTAFIRKSLNGSLLKVGIPTQDTIQFQVPNLLESHTLYVRAVDNLGVRDPSPASQAFTLKTLAPNTQIVSGPLDGDTLFCLSAFTTTWKGIVFSVNPSDTMDPDGRVVGWYWAVDETIPNRQTWRYTTNPACTLSNLADGPHTFAISARDNADAMDPTPAIRHFTTYRPLFNQGILLVDETGTGDYLDPTDAQVDSVYHLVLRNAGRTWDDWDNSEGTNRPTKEVLRRYSLVLWYSDEVHLSHGFRYFPQDTARIRDYLNVGGKLWLTGFRNLNGLNSGADPINKSYSSGTFERAYLGISAANTNTKTTWRDADSCFAGTWGVLPGYPDSLVMDSTKILVNWRGRLQAINVLSPAGSDVLLGFKSSPFNPSFEHLPCAIRYQGPTFRTVFFSFPLYQVKIDASGEPLVSIFRQTLTYLGE